MAVGAYLKALFYTAYVRWTDATSRHSTRVPSDLTKALYDLRRDGYVNLGPLVPLGDLPERLATALSRGEIVHPGVTRFYLKNPFLVAPDIATWLSLRSVNTVVKAYLGDGAIFDRCLVWRIPAAAHERKTSAIWHHDWCGRQLKLFILLHDVMEVGRPTQYVIGSHRSRWRWMNYALSRFDDAKIPREGHVTKLTGRAGDCILVDTGGLHRATGEGGYEARDVISFEYSDRRKSGFLAERGFEVGVRYEEFLGDFATEGTLLSPSFLRKSGDRMAYGFIPQLEQEPFI